MLRRLRPALRFLLALDIPRGAGVLATLALFALALGYGAVRGGHADALGAQWRTARDVAAGTLGFRIGSVALTGNRQIGREEILATAGVTGTASLLFLDADGARERLKANPWIADATVLKLFPNRLHIAVTERQAFALWQKEGRVAVIAADGTVLQPYPDGRFAGLPLVVGRGAERAASDFLAVADLFPALREQVRAFVLVAERRWNLRLKNGIDVRLPEVAPARALELLVALDRESRLLSRDIAMVDLRQTDRIAVRLSEAAAAARAEALRVRGRRKGGDA